MSTSRGVDRGSVAMYRLRVDHPSSDEFFNQLKLARAIIRLWAKVVGHNHLGGVSQVVGTSISVGSKIFSIAVS